jgi:hypothetical protein
MSEDMLNKIYNKVEKISDDVGALKVTSAIHEETLQTHIKRSDTLEKMYLDMKEKDIEPIKTDINQFKGVFKFLTGISAVGGFIFGLLKFFRKI